MNKDVYAKYLSFLLLLLVLLLAALMIYPFLSAIVTAGALVYIFYPVYKRLDKKIKRPSLSSSIMVLLIIVMVILPLFIILNALISEATSVFAIFRDNFPERISFVQDITAYLNDHFGVTYDFSKIIDSVTISLINNLKNFLASLPQKLLNFFILIILMYYLFKQGHELVRVIKNLLPLDKKKSTALFTRIEHTTQAVLYGHIATAFVQGIAGGVGYYIFGVESPVFWGIATLFFALLPVMGAPIVYFPLSIYLLFQNWIMEDILGVAKAVGLLFYGVLIISSIDNIIKPKIISSRTNIHPGLIILGILGGLTMFGFIGIIVGPIIFVLVISLFQTFVSEM